MEAQSFKGGCSGSPRGILATMALSLHLSTLRPSSSHPFLSPLPSSDEHPGISEGVTRGPALSCERKPRNECHSLRGAQLERQQNNGGSYERHGHTVHKQTHSGTHTHPHTHLQTHFSNRHQPLLFFKSNLASLQFTVG